MKRLSNDMARRLNRLGCKSAELVEVTSWLINQGYWISLQVIQCTDRNAKLRIYYTPYVTPLQTHTSEILLHCNPPLGYSTDYMEAYETALQWVIDNKIDPKTAEEETAEEVTQEELQ